MLCSSAHRGAHSCGREPREATGASRGCVVLSVASRSRRSSSRASTARGREQIRARSGQLDGQGQPVEVGTQLARPAQLSRSFGSPAGPERPGPRTGPRRRWRSASPGAHQAGARPVARRRTPARPGRVARSGWSPVRSAAPSRSRRAATSGPPRGRCSKLSRTSSCSRATDDPGQGVCGLAGIVELHPQCRTDLRGDTLGCGRPGSGRPGPSPRPARRPIEPPPRRPVGSCRPPPAPSARPTARPRGRAPGSAAGPRGARRMLRTCREGRRGEAERRRAIAPVGGAVAETSRLELEGSVASSGSCRRIGCSSRRSEGLGSTPSWSTSRRRPSR